MAEVNESTVWTAHSVIKTTIDDIDERLSAVEVAGEETTATAAAFLSKNKFIAGSEVRNILHTPYEWSEDYMHRTITSSGGINHNVQMSYVITPTVEIEGGKTYVVKMLAKIGSSTPGVIATNPAGTGGPLYGYVTDQGTGISAQTGGMAHGLQFRDNFFMFTAPESAVGVRFTLKCTMSSTNAEADRNYAQEAHRAFNNWKMIETQKTSIDEITDVDFEDIMNYPYLDAKTVSEIIRADGSKIPVTDQRVPQIQQDIANLKDAVGEADSFPLGSKTIVVFGDSNFANGRITLDTKDSRDIAHFIGKYTRADMLNCAIGGTRMAIHSLSKYLPFSMYKIADAISAGDFSEIGAVASGDTPPSGAEYVYNTIKEIDFSAVDTILIHFGANDWSSDSVVLDNPNDPMDTMTFAGALRYSLEKIQTAYPDIRILVSGILYRVKLENDEFVEDADTWKNSLGKTCWDFDDKLREVCAEYHVDFADNRDIGFNKFTRSAYYADSTHLNERGRERFARKLVGKDIF